MRPLHIAAASAALALALALTLTLTGCASRTEPEITAVSVDETDTVLTVSLASCNGDPELSAIEETPDAIRLSALADRPGSNAGACSDTVTVTLTDPLADRVVVDIPTGVQLEVGRTPAETD